MILDEWTANKGWLWVDVARKAGKGREEEEHD